MSEPITQRTLVAVSALRQSIEMNGGPGTSVNRHPNPFMLNIIGELDLLKAVELVLKRVAQFDADVKREQEAKADRDTAASAVDGH